MPYHEFANKVVLKAITDYINSGQDPDVTKELASAKIWEGPKHSANKQPRIWFNIDGINYIIEIRTWSSS